MYDRYLNMKEKKMTNPELIYLCRQLSMLLKAGISLLEGISILRDDADTKDGQKILSVIYDELLETGDIQSALEKTEVFPSYFVHMVKMGELSGNLDDTFASLAAHYEREEALTGSIRDALTYPLIMLGMLSAVLLVLIVKVMPVFNQVYEQLGSQITGPAAVLLKTGEVLKQYWVIPAVFICIFAAGVWWLLKTIKGNTVLRRLTGRFFSSKSIVKRLNSARISSALSKIAVQVDEEVTAEIQNFVSVIEPTMVIILSILVGALLLSVMMPLMGILSVIG